MIVTNRKIECPFCGRVHRMELIQCPYCMKPEIEIGEKNMKFDPNKVLTVFTKDQANEGDWGWFGDSEYGLIQRVGIASYLQELKLVDKDTPYIFRTLNNGYEYFYPAPYELAQKKWVEKHDLKVGDRVKVVRGWEKGECGFDCAMGFLQEVNLIGYVDSIEKGSIYIVLHSGPYHVPYFAIEKVKAEYRPFANAEEFEPYRDNWWRHKDGRKVFRVRSYDDVEVSISYYDTWDYKTFFNNFVNADTGEPAGVKL